MAFLLDTIYLLPLTATFLTLAVGGLALRARSRRGYGPFTLGILAAAGLLVGKFVLASPVTLYAAVATLIAASLWNAWPRRPRPRPLPSLSR